MVTWTIIAWNEVDFVYICPVEGEGNIVGKRAINFVLPDQDGKDVALNQLCRTGPLLLVFYPGDFTPVCTKQLCNYRDTLSQFKEFGLNIVGVSANTSEEHRNFASQYNFEFPLLTDPQKDVAKRFGCTSLLMLGKVSRACFILNRDMLILYRYVEPTTLSARSATELLAVIRDLRIHKLI